MDNNIVNAQSQPRGYWIPTNNGCMCSECHAEINESDAVLSYECPNCHALMGEQDYKIKEEE